jgi:hypothetical protein
VSIEDINLKEKIKDKGEVTLQDEGEELRRWVSIEDINFEGKVKNKGNIIYKLIRLEGKVKDEGDVIYRFIRLFQTK